MKLQNNESEKFALMREKLCTSVVGDILDNMGYYYQFLPQDIHPLREDMKTAGKTVTVLIIDVYGLQKKSFGFLTEVLDQSEENEIYIVAGGSKRYAYWGELLTATARCRKVVGAMVNGWHRDTPQVLSQDWPVFSYGCYAQDSSVRTQMADCRCDIEIGQVTIHDGDLIFGDVDGVLIVPRQVTDEVIEKTLEKATGEKVVRKAIESGMTTTAAFEKYGTLQEWRDAYDAERT